ncbi:hypothetical protein [uncultured Parabacteroides sp.]|uniref:hypothetical protein n=1 Tax=uncultured Parabacteroides sp. TaxID=512312 RepID=UPI002625C55E|nr:hypothetical protein [uncultured Parabacteroides sp.]
MQTYSIVIRTLGTGGDKFRQELISITKQSVQPEQVLIYIAEGYSRPNFTIGKEKYIWVKKGMMAQRILPYNEITSDCILMLDDDVCLAVDSAERMLAVMETYKADCVGADTFRNQDMPFKGKLYVAVTNLVFPHYSRKWAFKIHQNGSFSYNNHPVKSFYWSQSCAGPASLWRKNIYHQLHLEDELWLDNLEFAYGDDVLGFYKLYKNGFRLGILYDSGISHLNGGSSSSAFRKSPQWMYIRTKASFVIWWRTCYKPGDTSLVERVLALLAFGIKTVWLFFIVCLAAVIGKNRSFIFHYIKGVMDGWCFVHSTYFRFLPNYVIRQS